MTTHLIGSPRPGWRVEKHLWRTGARRVAGVDEVGRGPLAGPVVAAAVVIPQTGGGWNTRARWIARLRDSKLLTARQRDELAAIIRERAEWGIAAVSVQVVDQINILQATRLAMKRALAALPSQPDAIIVDGRDRIETEIRQEAHVDADAHCVSVAAASIIAKVYRDALMCEYDRCFPGYGFADHKGYATPEHFEALRRHGYSNLHRLSFQPVRAALGAKRDE
jgi:ribonuclease HII